MADAAGDEPGKRSVAGQFLIGIDVGTTSVKGAMFDLNGRVISQYSGAVATRRPAAAMAEQVPAEWLKHVLAALEHVCQGAEPSAVAGIGLCSQVNTHVFVDDSGEPLMPAIIWQDGRCAAEAARLDALVPQADRLDWWGAPLPIDASHVLSRMAWVARHRPDIWARTRWVMAPKDFCIFHLTGHAVADPMSNFGIIDGALSYIDKLIDLVPGARHKLPPLAGSTELAGVVKAGLPCPGVPLAVATMDAWSGILGAGARRDGDAVYLSGTSEVLALVSETRVPTPGVIAFPKCEGMVLHVGPTQAGGASVAWLSQLLGRSPGELSNLVANGGAHKSTPIFLPHLQGERAPLWDPASRASFSGMDSATGPADLARAVFEGVSYSVRLLLESLESSAGISPGALTLAGGGMKSDEWCQIRADVLGKPLRRATNLDAGVFGAAMYAGVATGLFPSLAEASASLVKIGREFLPNPARKARHDFGFAQYLLLYRQLREFNAGMTSFSGW